MKTKENIPKNYYLGRDIYFEIGKVTNGGTLVGLAVGALCLVKMATFH